MAADIRLWKNVNNPAPDGFRQNQINMKYVVTVQENGEEEIFVFPDSVYHKDMAEAVQRLKEHDPIVHGKWRRIERRPISAGFVRGGKCEGNSESLGLRARPHDSDLLPRIAP